MIEKLFIVFNREYKYFKLLTGKILPLKSSVVFITL